MIVPLEGDKPPGGLFFRRHENGTHTVLGSAGLLYDYTDDDHPTLDLGYV